MYTNEDENNTRHATTLSQSEKLHLSKFGRHKSARYLWNLIKEQSSIVVHCNRVEKIKNEDTV